MRPPTCPAGGTMIWMRPKRLKVVRFTQLASWPPSAFAALAPLPPYGCDFFRGGRDLISAVEGVTRPLTLHDTVFKNTSYGVIAHTCRILLWASGFDAI